MKLRRKFLQMLDLRVQQHRAGQMPTNSSYRLGRLHSVESLVSDPTDSSIHAYSDKAAEISSM